MLYDISINTSIITCSFSYMFSQISDPIQLHSAAISSMSIKAPPRAPSESETSAGQSRRPTWEGSRFLESDDMSPSLHSQQAAFNGEVSSTQSDLRELDARVTSIASNPHSGTDIRQAGSNGKFLTKTVYDQTDLSSDGSLHYLREKINLLEAENKSFRKLYDQPLRIETLHTVSEGPRSPPATFLDEPTWRIGPRGQAMLKALYPIPDVDGYLSQQHNIAFVIVKFYDLDEQGEQAADAHRDKRPLPRPRPTTEHVHLQSAEMIEAVEASFTQQPKFAEEFPNFNIRNPISAPYLFWYHYGSPTALDGLPASHSGTMRLLTWWIDEHYGELYNRVKANSREAKHRQKRWSFCSNLVTCWYGRRKTT